MARTQTVQNLTPLPEADASVTGAAVDVLQSEKLALAVLVKSGGKGHVLIDVEWSPNDEDWDSIDRRRVEIPKGDKLYTLRETLDVLAMHVKIKVTNKTSATLTRATNILIHTT